MFPTLQIRMLPSYLRVSILNVFPSAVTDWMVKHDTIKNMTKIKITNIDEDIYVTVQLGLYLTLSVCNVIRT